MRNVNVKLSSAAKRFVARPLGVGSLLAAAALLHVALVAGLFLAGRAQVAPGIIDRDGIMPSFAGDSYLYGAEAARLARILKEGGPGAWAAEPERAHVRIISLLFVLFAPLFGQSPLSAEPFNLLCYVAILGLVFALGREVGGRRVGLVSAGVVALWPTFLLHTTQLLKDPLFIAGALALVLIVTTWLTRTYDRRGAAVMGALMALTTGTLLLVRVKFGVILYGVVFVGFALLVARQLLERRLLFWNLICPALILTAGALAPLYLVARGRPPAASYGLRAAADRAAVEVSQVRQNYVAWHPNSGSVVDGEVEFKNINDLILYLPRALAVGLWAPFPKDWVSAGRMVGLAGRLLSGVETFVIYLCELLALVCVWREPRCLAAWLLLLITTSGVTALGLVISNVGALYRFRYLFWVLLIILGVKGFESVVIARRA
jgi:4-amino-4-deoxy-L-arabinose transferase-like glycosyltransferase